MSKIEEALVAALAEIQHPPLDGQANYGRYATLAACLASARRTLPRHNLTVIQMAYTEPDRLVPRIIHSSGEWIEDGGVPLLCDNKANPQKMGSALTYSRRYGICSMLGLVGQDDDDAQFATPLAELPPSSIVPNHWGKEERVVMEVVPPPKIVADEIPFDKSDERRDWTSWVDQQIDGFQKHRHVGDHTKWSREVREERELLAIEEPETHDRLLEAYRERKFEFEKGGK